MIESDQDVAQFFNENFVRWIRRRRRRAWAMSPPSRALALSSRPRGQIAAIGDGSEFKNGRHLAVWIGLVPRQFSSGDRKVLMAYLNAGASICESPGPRRARRRPNGAIQNGSQQQLSQSASRATRLQPCNGCCRQQERTDHLGRASNWRAVPRCLLKTPQSLRDDGEMSCTGRTGAQRA